MPPPDKFDWYLIGVVLLVALVIAVVVALF